MMPLIHPAKNFDSLVLHIPVLSYLEPNQGQNTSSWAWHCWTPGLLNSICQSIFKQAGLVMYTSEFNAFVWEQEAKILDLPYFYLGIYKFPFCCVVWINVIDILSLWHFGRWQWCITHSFYLGKFVWKNIFVEINSEMILYNTSYVNYRKRNLLE